jgi:transmembrane sensor
MTDPSSSLPCDLERDPTHLAAADWFVRLHGREVSIEDTLAWQAWLNESPENARAFARIEEVSQVLRSVPLPPPVSALELARDGYDASIPLKEWAPPRRWFRPRQILALAAVLAGAAFALTVALWESALPNTYRTAVGENRVISLSDGSSITLGGDTHVEVSMSRRARAIELLSGEALFKVARDVNRPFEVRVGDATVVAVGTAFDVERGSDRAIVSVTEGRVVVEPVTHFLPVVVLQEFKPKLRAVHLGAGQQTIIAGSAGIEEPTQVVDTAAATAWQSGRLAFRLEPLRYVLEDVNRYARKPVVLEGNGLDSLLITGTVERENITGWISSLERAFDLQATEEADRIVIRPR